MIIHLLYIDPGTGSLIYQALVAGIVSISLFYKRIISFFKKKSSGKDMVENDEPNPFI